MKIEFKFIKCSYDQKGVNKKYLFKKDKNKQMFY